MKRPLCLACLTLCLMPLAGCGSDDRSPNVRETTEAPVPAPAPTPAEAPAVAPDDPAAMADALAEAFGEQGWAVETVDFRTLRGLLPEEMGGLRRVDAQGEDTGMAGLSISQTGGEYHSEDGKRRVSLQIVDGGGLGQMAMLGASWLNMDVDRESRDGYERTTEYEGYPAFEKMRTGDRLRSELQFVVADRFFVSAEGQNVEMDDLKDALEAIDLDALAALRNEAVQQ